MNAFSPRSEPPEPTPEQLPRCLAWLRYNDPITHRAFNDHPMWEREALVTALIWSYREREHLKKQLATLVERQPVIIRKEAE